MKLIKNLSFGFIFLICGCQPIAWVDPNISNKNNTNFATIYAPLNTGLRLFYIDGEGKYYHGFFHKYDRYQFSPGHHTIGIGYEGFIDIHTTLESTKFVEIEVNLEPNGKYYGEALVRANKWLPVIKEQGSGRIVSKPTGKTYE